MQTGNFSFMIEYRTENLPKEQLSVNYVSLECKGTKLPPLFVNEIKENTEGILGDDQIWNNNGMTRDQKTEKATKKG